MLLERCSTPTALDPTFLAACLNPAKCKGRHGPPLETISWIRSMLSINFWDCRSQSCFVRAGVNMQKRTYWVSLSSSSKWSRTLIFTSYQTQKSKCWCQLLFRGWCFCWILFVRSHWILICLRKKKVLAYQSLLVYLELKIKGLARVAQHAPFLSRARKGKLSNIISGCHYSSFW